MKIAHILPESIKFPLTKHNGRYMWVKNFLEEMSKGSSLEIVVYCNKESIFENKNIQVVGLDNPGDNKDENNKNLFIKALEDKSIDLFHSHFDNLHYEVGHLTDKTILFTQHWQLTEETINLCHSYKGKNIFAVPATAFQASINTKNEIPSKKYIHYGVNLDLFKFNNSERNNKLIFIGRIAQHKGVIEAAQIAINTSSELDIYGKVEEKDKKYFQKLQDLIKNTKVKYLGPLEFKDVPNKFSQYKAFLFPVQGVEAFGMVFIECMATGTPVLTLNIGPTSEIVEDGISGFVSENIDELGEKVNEIDRVKAEDCRRQAEKFKYSTMISNYASLYKEILA